MSYILSFDAFPFKSNIEKITINNKSFVDVFKDTFSSYTNKTAAANLSFSYTVTATDNLSSISYYWLNDTTNFTISYKTYKNFRQPYNNVHNFHKT
jgi:hypothetical protein